MSIYVRENRTLYSCFSNIRLKGCLFVVAISAKEKEVIAERFPDIHIRRTVKQKSKRHHYYVEESRGVMRILKSLRKSA